MNNTMINKKQRFFAFRLALKIGAAELLVILLLGMFGQWVLVPPLLAMAVLFSLYVLVVLAMRRFTILPVYPIYGIRDSLLDPDSLSREYEPVKPEQEDLKPFVFKEHLWETEHE